MSLTYESTRALFSCDQTPLPVELQRQAWDYNFPLNSEGHDVSLALRIDGLAGKIVGTIDTRAADLIRIAAYAFGADQSVSRGANDIHRTHWRREMTLCLEVSDPEFWAADTTHDALTAALGYGTDDRWAFRFSALPPDKGQLHLPVEDGPLLGEPDSVMLVSGGTDSLCALMDAALTNGTRPLVVSHRSAPSVDSVQKGVLDGVRRHVPGWSFPPMSFWIHHRGSEAASSSQRTRGFLFAALGIGVAGQLGLRRVLLPDNGYVSINPLINEQLVGALASRGTHPAFLRLVNHLAERIFPNGPQVENPLATKTRAQALGVLKAYGAEDLLPLTRTCGKFRDPKRSNDVPHCGGCSQCIDRRFAVISAGLEAFDPVSKFGLDVFTQDLPP